ncbi:MAG TPA: glycosyltransferase family 2 protein [Acidimicrobiales bacterium]|nr:glycosyltransferase family 2 protein [Acidimicrobiales bacterium]
MASPLPAAPGRAGTPASGRRGELRRQMTELGRQDFLRRHPDAHFGPVVALFASYLEADNIGPVLRRVPTESHGMAVSTLVVVDGGDDSTDEVVAEAGAYCAVLPVNMGQGVALRLGYQLAAEHGAKYVVTVDADGQDEPGAISDLLAPLVSGEADFVIASRRLGTDETTDPMRRAGAVVFSAVINRLIGQHLTDTSNGLRALRIEVLEDVTLEQDQYQTAELIISAAARGWRLAEVPVVRHPRTSGTSKKGRNALFAYRYARVIARTWWRERRRSR